MNKSDQTSPPCQKQTQGGARLAEFGRDWAFARASEASTLFINQSIAAAPPFMRIQEPHTGCFKLESFDGRTRTVYDIDRVETRNDEIILHLSAQAGSTHDGAVFTLYPYWDIDDTWVVIQDIPGLEEKPISFALPRELAHRIEVMPDGYP